jgi:hypothetical protein
MDARTVIPQAIRQALQKTQVLRRFSNGCVASSAGFSGLTVKGPGNYVAPRSAARLAALALAYVP